jgi:hypothetical protein
MRQYRTIYSFYFIVLCRTMVATQGGSTNENDNQHLEKQKQIFFHFPLDFYLVLWIDFFQVGWSSKIVGWNYDIDSLSHNFF